MSESSVSPPSPPSLADMLASRAGLGLPKAPPPPMGGLGGALSGLKPSGLRAKFEKKKITDYDVDEFKNHRNKSASERFRELDNFRLHTPMEEEVSFLNVTTYRMNLSSMQDILFLCGGLVGVRFSSEDLVALTGLNREMNRIWLQLDGVYGQLSSTAKKLIVTDDQVAAARQALEESSTCKDGGNPTSAVAAKMEAVSESPAGGSNSGGGGGGGSSSGTADEGERVGRFHALADLYLTSFAKLQHLMREKQSTIDPNSRTELRIDADPESKVGLKIPLWLSTLIEKHELSMAPAPAAAGDGAGTAGAAAAPSSSEASSSSGSGSSSQSESSSKKKFEMKSRTKLKVGQLAVFLGACMGGRQRIQCTPEESDALYILVQASNDVSLNISDSEVQRSSSPVLFASAVGASQLHSHKYWARRFYNFLSKMTELSSAIKDEAALDVIDD